MAQYVFTMNRLGKIVPPKREILKGVSLSFFPGAKIGVLGLNGSGKSTLLKIMAGAEENYEGEVIRMPGIQVGFLPQEPALEAEKTVREVVEQAAGDIITKVQGKTVDRYSDLPRLVGMVKPGEKVQLQVFHDGKFKEVTADVVDFGPETPPIIAAGPDPEAIANTKATLGLKVVDLTEAERARLHVKSGVRVDSVEGAAARAGVQEGDVILQIGNVAVSSAKQFIATVAKLDKAKSIAVLVRRGDSANYLVIRPSK